MAPQLLLYATSDGGSPVLDYLRAQSKRVRGHAGWLLTRLEREGHALGRPAAAHLGGGIYELRVIVDGEHHRVLYFFSGDVVVATNGFLKKSGRVPAAEIEKARRARMDWLRREGAGS